MEPNDQRNIETILHKTHSFSDNWQERILIPTILAGVVGGGIGLVSKRQKVHGLANICATYATNSAVVAGCYCGMREFARSSRQSEHGDLMNSVVGGIFSGALLGRLQGGHIGAMRYAAIFTVVGTAVDYAALRLTPHFEKFRDSMSGDELKLPEWSPIQILDEEALAAKKSREQQLYAHKLKGARDVPTGEELSKPEKFFFGGWPFGGFGGFGRGFGGWPFGGFGGPGGGARGLGLGGPGLAAETATNENIADENMAYTYGYNPMALGVGVGNPNP